METRTQTWLKFALDQHLIRFEEELSRHLPRGNWASFDRNAILRGDTEPEAEEPEEPEDDTPDAPAEEEGETGGDSDTDLAQ